MENQVPLELRGIDKAEYFFAGYGRFLSKLLKNMDYKAMEQVVQLLIDKTKEGSAIFLVGNGGSATTATHFASDLIQCSRPDKGLIFKATSMAENISLLTALGNDYSYKEIFTKQMINLFVKNDILIVISASGNSPNILVASRLAKKIGGIVVGLIGFDGGKLISLCDYVILVKTDKGEYGLVEDIHMVIDHMVTSYLRLKLSKA